MTHNLEQKRTFLVAHAEAEVRTRISEYIQRHLAGSQIHTAINGTEALTKLENFPPNILVVAWNLPGLSGIQIVERVLASRAMQDVMIIALTAIPDNEHFVDEVVMGRVQFFKDLNDEKNFVDILYRSLNRLSTGTKAEFYLKFLAPGEVLIKEGERGESVYVVRRGSLLACLKRGEEVVELGKIEAGEFVGEMAYINNELRSADVVAVTDCELIEIPVGFLDHVLFQKPAWSKALMQTLSKRVKNANKKQAKSK